MCTSVNLSDKWQVGKYLVAMLINRRLVFL